MDARELHSRLSINLRCCCIACATFACCAVGALAGGMMFGLDDQLPKFEASARELVHPLFDKLKAEVGHAVLCCAVLCCAVLLLVLCCAGL
jgi:hypothetical protein